MDASSSSLELAKERKLEKLVGIEVYSTLEYPGIGGMYKNSYKDFIVKEITNDGVILDLEDDDNITETFDSKYRFTTFNLIKVNRDTFDAIRLIAKALRIPEKLIEYSGLKDKCSISVQKVSIRGNYVKKLKILNIRDIFIRSVSQTKKSVRLGSNWGNKFIITIRNVEKKPKYKKNIENLLNRINIRGFPNYYGLQRFGTFRPNSHLIGRYLLEGDYKKAYDEFVLNTYETELEVSRKVRSDLKESGDLKKALIDFPKSLNYERDLVAYLIDNPGDYEGAIKSLPSYLTKLIISSFQSYVFNKLLTLRVERCNSLFRPVKGDVISILDDNNGQTTQVKYVFGGIYDEYLEEAIRLKRASIVIPLIGYDTDLKEFPLMQELLDVIFKKEKINPSIFSHYLIKELDFKGAFRTILEFPKDVNLIKVEPDDLFPKKLKVKVEFSLSKGSYATMLLREIIK